MINSEGREKLKTVYLLSLLSVVVQGGNFGTICDFADPTLATTELQTRAPVVERDPRLLRRCKVMSVLINYLT